MEQRNCMRKCDTYNTQVSITPCSFSEKMAHCTHIKHRIREFVMTKPRIGIPLGSKETTFSRLPHYAMEKNYFDAITKLGGLPIALPYAEENFDEYIQMVDGILLPGGSFASPQHWYTQGTAQLPEACTWSNFLEKVTRTAVDKKIPVLGICAGMQFLSCVNGAKMTINVAHTLNSPLDHLNGKPKEERYHLVKVEKGTLLHDITDMDEFMVNSAHTEAVVSLSESLKQNATAEDGCIEAVEVLNHPFALGVQWHPEFFTEDETSPDFKLMKAFIDVTKQHR